MEKAINQALSDKFHELLEESAFTNRLLDVQVCRAQEVLVQTLTEDQQNLFNEVDSIMAEDDAYRLEMAFRRGFLEGLNVGRSIL